MFEVLGELLRAAAIFFGRCSVGHRSSDGLYRFRICRATVTLCTSVGPSTSAITGADIHMPPSGSSFDTPKRAVDLDRALHDVLQHLRHEHLHRGDVVADLAVVLVAVDRPRGVQARTSGTARARRTSRRSCSARSACPRADCLASRVRARARTSCRAPSGTCRRCASRGGCARRPSGSARSRTPDPRRRAGSRPARGRSRSGCSAWWPCVPRRSPMRPTLRTMLTPGVSVGTRNIDMPW